MLLQQALEQSAQGPLDTPYAMTYLQAPDPGVAVFVGIAKEVPPQGSWAYMIWVSTNSYDHKWRSVTASPYLIECDEWEPLYRDHPYRQSLLQHLRNIDREGTPYTGSLLHGIDRDWVDTEELRQRIRGIRIQPVHPGIQLNPEAEIQLQDAREHMLAEEHRHDPAAFNPILNMMDDWV